MGVREACARSHLPPCRIFGAWIETDFVVESTRGGVVLSTFLYLLESGPAPAQNMPEEDEVESMLQQLGAQRVMRHLEESIKTAAQECAKKQEEEPQVR